KKAGHKTDMKTETGVSYLLKEGRFGSYLESENFKEDGLREALLAEIRKELKAGSIEKIDGIYQIQEKIRQIKEEEEKLIREAGVCEKCGKPFKVNRGRWGKFLSCIGYPECRNIRKIEKK
ncbi:topoisomerase DNA-binding C4 zinc finger domain-containing protein, partial [Fusobacterium necrophorum]|uniref:topoisomerase DNA-binding C4 zinc finger domain-containing protein n=1 Tax=Fusobacterium necrophorum TaxID=859 RepID=UPI00254AE4FB